MPRSSTETVSITRLATLAPSQPPAKTRTLAPISQNEIIASPEQTPCQDDLEILASFGTTPGEAVPSLVVWPGEIFNLGWRIRNSGACVWDSAYTLEQQDTDSWGNSGGQPAIPLSERVVPGESINIQLDLQSPLIPGEYLLSWSIWNGYRKQVGQALRVRLQVPADANHAPLPTLTPAPNVKFEVSSAQVAPYDKVVLAWDVQQANAVYFYSLGQAWQSNRVPLKGVRIYYPTISTLYNLRVVNIDNTVESYKYEVEVTPLLGVPEIVLFELLPDRRAPLGRCIEISWSVRGGLTTSINLYADGASLVANGDRQGGYTDCPTHVGLRVYLLVANGRTGVVQKTRSIVIEE